MQIVNYQSKLEIEVVIFVSLLQESHIRETKHLSTNADSSTDTKKILLERQNSPKKNLFLRGDFTPFISKSFHIWDYFFILLFPKDSENLKSLDIGH